MSTPQRPLTRAEVYQLAVYWKGEQRKSELAIERLAAIHDVLGAEALQDVPADVASNEEFGEEGYQLDEPTISLPDEPCHEFTPIAQEHLVLASLYRSLRDSYITRASVMTNLAERLRTTSDDLNSQTRIQE